MSNYISDAPWHSDEFTREVIRGVQAEGTCWLSGTRWHDQDAMRISVSNWSTTETDIDRAATAILTVVRRELAATAST